MDAMIFLKKNLELLFLFLIIQAITVNLIYSKESDSCCLSEGKETAYDYERNIDTYDFINNNNITSYANIYISENQGQLQPESDITVTWDSLPKGTMEFELLLRWNFPTPLILRLTKSQDPNTDRFLWQIPNIPCGEAFLLLRIGKDGKEILWAKSPLFSIRQNLNESFPKAILFEGEYWLKEQPVTEKFLRNTWNLRFLLFDKCPVETNLSTGFQHWLEDQNRLFIFCSLKNQNPIGISYDSFIKKPKIQIRI